MITALIATVGGTPQPLIESISKHHPKYVCFICSQESVDKIAEIKSALLARNLYRDEMFKDYKVLVDDINDLVSCYERAQEAAAKLKDWGIAAEEILVDYTGGTKTMSVAVGLATAVQGYGFSYVGGHQRTKDGLGIVIDGTEQVRVGVSPWSLFAVEERRRIADFFNHYQFEAARHIVDDLLSRKTLDSRLRSELNIVKNLCIAYSHWERFAHAEAIKVLDESIKLLEQFLAIRSDSRYEQFLETVNANSNWLQRMRSESEGFRKPTHLQVADLIANGERRSAEGKFDDAVARLYRALEMEGQVSLSEPPLQIESASDVPPEKIPESIRDDFQKRYASEPEGKIKLPLQAVYELLAEAGHPRGLKFSASWERLRGLLKARNDSILAHGLQPIKESSYQSLKETLTAWLGDNQAVEFPQLPV